MHYVNVVLKKNFLRLEVGGYRMPLYEMSDALYQRMISIYEKDKELIF